MAKTRQWMLVLPTWVCLLVLAWGAHGGANTVKESQVLPEHVPLEYLPGETTAQLVSLGHHNTLADIFWVRSLLYFANELSERQSYEWLLQYLEVIIALDTDFVDVYRWGGAALIISNKVITFEDVQRANTLLERGATQFPDNWRLPEAAAANCSYYVTDPSPQEREQLKACQNKFVNMAAQRPGAPFTLRLLASSLASGDEKRMCELLIDAYFSGQQDPKLRAQIENRMVGGLCGEVSADLLRDQVKRFKDAHRETYPYAPEDLVVHIVDLDDWAQQGEANQEVDEDLRPDFNQGEAQGERLHEAPGAAREEGEE